MRFGARLASAVAQRGPLCAGIDPHPSLLEAWGLPVSVDGLQRFADVCVDAIAGEVAVVKPQSAFFEAYGSEGIAVLERTIAGCRDAGALVLLDVKRGDIGSTMAAYARAYLTDSSPLAADAITVSPYLGFGSLTPALELAEQSGRGLFVLARTSNPEGEAVQHATSGGRSVAQRIVDSVAACNAGIEPIGDIGVVVGATIAGGDVDLSTVNGPVLAPGFGAQGATVVDLKRLFGETLTGVLAASSRDILRHGPDPATLRGAVHRVQASLTA